MPSARSVLQPERLPGAGGVGGVTVGVVEGPGAPASGRSRTPARRPARPRPCPSRHTAVRTSRCSASSSAGGRVCGVVSSGPVRGAMVSASRTSSHPLGVCQVVTSTFVPGLVGARRRHVDAVRREPEVAGAAVEQAAEDARAVERGHAQPVDRPVRRHQRAGVAVGQEGVVGDRREGRGRGCSSPWGPPRVGRQPSRSSRWSPTRSAFAIAVRAGFTAPMLGKKLVSTT